MAEEYVLKKMTPKQLRKKLAFGFWSVMAGLVLMVISVGLGLFLNLDRYGGHGVTAVAVAARVSDSESVFTEEEQDGASMIQERWYLLAEYQYQGETRTVRLDDYFVDKSYVQQYIGETRELYIDANTFEKLEQRPFNPVFLVFLAIGLSLSVYGLLLRFRYTDYKQRLLPAVKRQKKVRQSVSYVRRGGIHV